MKIISIVLLLASAFLSIKHGWDAFQPASVEQAKMMSILGVTKYTMPYFAVLSILIGLMLFFPQTFFISNVLNAVTIVLIMEMSLRAGNYKIALIEIPFLVLPLIMIWLKYPFRN
jgi:hypothetical protein